MCTEIDFDIQNIISPCSAKRRSSDKDLPVQNQNQEAKWILTVILESIRTNLYVDLGWHFSTFSSELQPNRDKDEIRVNPGGTSRFGHYGEKNVTYCTLRRPNKEVALLNDFQKNPDPNGRNTR